MMAEPNDDDRLDAERFLDRYGEASKARGWERLDLVMLIAELRERYTARVAELERQLADVRTLDEWKSQSSERSVVLDGDNWFWCRLSEWNGRGIRQVMGFDGASAHEARAAAAAWVRAEQAKKEQG